MKRWAQIATALAEAARHLMDHPSVDTMLDRIVSHAVDVVEGCTAASVMEVANGRVRTVATTGPQATEADRLQVEMGEGPAFVAAATAARAYELPDAEAWPDLTAKIRGTGFASMLGYVLHAGDDGTFGALHLYGAEPGAFGEQARWVGPILASHCAVALSATQRGEAMQRALRDSRTVGIAVGVLMDRYRVTEDDAFALLSRYSRDHDIRVHDVATAVRRTGDLPHS